jgi:short-subunit dehydrogenase
VARQRTILITGATGSIGGAAALALSKSGARVVLLGRSARRLDAKAASIREALSNLDTDSSSGDIATLTVDFSEVTRFPRVLWTCSHRYLSAKPFENRLSQAYCPMFDSHRLH